MKLKIQWEFNENHIRENRHLNFVDKLVVKNLIRLSRLSRTY